MGMIAKESVQTLLRNGIRVTVATSWRAFTATAVYWRIFSPGSEDFGGITDEGKVLVAFMRPAHYIYRCMPRHPGHRGSI
jgi:hypothetical protein